jgi:hypothetical protein
MFSEVINHKQLTHHIKLAVDSVPTNALKRNLIGYPQARNNSHHYQDDLFL